MPKCASRLSIRTFLLWLYYASHLVIGVHTTDGAAPIIGAYATAVDNHTFSSMHSSGVTHALVGFADVTAAVSVAGNVTCTAKVDPVSGWNSSIPRKGLFTLLSFGGAITADAGTVRAFLAHPECAGHALGIFSAMQGFHGVDFDIELSSYEQTHGTQTTPVLTPNQITVQLAKFMNSTVTAFYDANKTMPIVSVNPPIFWNDSVQLVQVPLLTQAVNQLLDFLPDDQKKQLLSPDKLLLSMQFYNCWVPNTNDPPPKSHSLVQCQGAGGTALIDTSWTDYSRLFGDEVLSSTSLIIGKPMAACCPDLGPGDVTICSDDVRFKIGETTPCAPFCAPSGNTPTTSKPLDSCGFESSDKLSAYLNGSKPLKHPAAGVFLWRWNLAYAQVESCSATPQFAAALSGTPWDSSNDLQELVFLNETSSKQFAQWQTAERPNVDAPTFDEVVHCSADKLCPLHKPCCQKQANDAVCGIAGDGYCDYELCLPFQSAYPGACTTTVLETCGAHVPKPSPVSASRCHASKHILGAHDSPVDAPSQILSPLTCGKSCNGYDHARIVFNKGFSSEPCFIYNCTSEQHVVKAMEFAYAHGIRAVVRAGGNSFEGYSTCDGNCVVVDVSGLKTSNISRASMIGNVGVATIGAGVTNAELYAALDKYSLSAVSGTCGAVGFAGLSLGGGLGVMMRKHGLAADNIIGLNVVLFNGTVVHATETDHAELFWAMRGGGNGNFGVATMFNLRVFDTTGQKWQIQQYRVNATDEGDKSDLARAQAFVAWQNWAAGLDDQAYSQYHMNPQYMHGFVFVYNGTNKEANASIKSLLAAVDPPLFTPVHGTEGTVNSTCGAGVYLSPTNLSWYDMTRCMGNCGKQTDWAFPGGYSRFGYPGEGNTGPASPALPPPNATLSIDAALALVQAYGSGEALGPGGKVISNWSDILIDSLGGEVARRSIDWNAFVHRRAVVHYQYNVYWNKAEQEWQQANEFTSRFLHKVYASTNDSISSYAYRNYPQANLTDYGDKYYGSNYPRLQRAKTIYDPENRFWYTQSVAPPGSNTSLDKVYSDNGTYVYFTDCDCTPQGCTEGERNRYVDACRKDLLASPFNIIMFGFANAVVDSATNAPDPFNIALDFEKIGVLSPTFIEQLHAVGKKAILSFGGGDSIGTSDLGDLGTSWTYTAVPRTFTALWNASCTLNRSVSTYNESMIERWAQASVAFANGNNSENVVFDGIDWDIEEAHDMNDPGWQPYFTPLHISEVLTNQSGVQFIAKLIVATRRALDANGRGQTLTIAIQPTYFAPSVQDDCAQRLPSLPNTPTFPLPSPQCTSYASFNCFLWMFSNFPDAKEALSALIIMLYPNGNMNVPEWNVKFFQHDTQAYDVPAVAQSIALYHYVEAGADGGGKTVQLGDDYVVVGMQVTENTTDNPFIAPETLSAQLSKSNQVKFKGIAMWQYGPRINRSCIYQQYLLPTKDGHCFLASSVGNNFVWCLAAVLACWMLVALYTGIRAVYGHNSSRPVTVGRAASSLKGVFMSMSTRNVREARRVSLAISPRSTSHVLADWSWLDGALDTVISEDLEDEYADWSLVDLIAGSIEHEVSGEFKEAVELAKAASERLKKALGGVYAQQQNFRMRTLVDQKAVQLDTRVGLLQQCLSGRWSQDDVDGLQEACYRFSGEAGCNYTAIMGTPAQLAASNHEFACRAEPTASEMNAIICVTMYNEDGEELFATLLKIARCIHVMCAKRALYGAAHLSAAQFAQTIAVVLVCDGREPLSDSAQAHLRSINLYDADAIAMGLLGDDRPTLHLFEGRVPLVVDGHKPDTDDGTLLSSTRGNDEAQMHMVVAIKEKNSGKLSSHAWALEGIAGRLNPKFVVLVDVGTKPSPESIHRLIEKMESDAQVGGVCGEIAVDVPFNTLSNAVIGAQHFEYKISHILDKALESALGFVTVLPGAFSAYRFCAIAGQPLNAYLKPVHFGHDFSPAEGNMYLAEDRILCFELLTQKSQSWLLRYVKGAVARTDVPDTLVKLVKQRRRWLNGSFFALLYSLRNMRRLFVESNHTLWRKCIISFQVVYLWIANIFVTWLMPALMYLVVDFVLVVQPVDGMAALTRNASLLKVLPSLLLVMEDIMVAVILTQTLISLSCNADQSYLAMKCNSLILAFIVSLAMGGIVANVIDWMSSVTFSVADDSGVPFAALIAIVVLPFALSFMHGELLHIATFFVHYTLLLPTFTIIFGIFAFANVHDLSWGTRPAEPKAKAKSISQQIRSTYEQALEGAATKRRKNNDENSLRLYRTKVFFGYAVCNCLLVFVVKRVDRSGSDFIRFTVLFASVVNILRSGGSVIFLASNALFGGLGASAERGKSRVEDDEDSLVSSQEPLIDPQTANMRTQSLETGTRKKGIRFS